MIYINKKKFIGRNRPDMVVLVRNICPFRGEEKSREEAGDPSNELVDKIKDWTYGDTPYIFAYYAIGTLVTFVTLYKPENKKRKLEICSERIAEFDLGRLSDRIHTMNFLRNICECFLSFKLLSQNTNLLCGYLGRILPFIVNLCPPRDSPEFQTIIQPNGTTIELGYAIKKKFVYEEQVTHLKGIYGMLHVSLKIFSHASSAKNFILFRVYPNYLYRQIILDFLTD